MSESFAGKLLVAGPELLDPNFDRTVVLVCLHDEDGAFGLVLNRPHALPVVDHLPAWGEWVRQPAVLFQGGPVEPESIVGLARTREAAALSIPVMHGLGLLNLAHEPGDWAGALDAVRIFAGYSGWGAGQLDMEVRQHSWFVVEATPEDPFTDAPADLWREVLRRQRGDTALFATLPRDPRLN